MTIQDWDDYIDQAARLLDLELTAEMRTAIRGNLEVAERMAKLVADYPLDDHAEPAPVYSA